MRRESDQAHSRTAVRTQEAHTDRAFRVGRDRPDSAVVGWAHDEHGGQDVQRRQTRRGLPSHFDLRRGELDPRRADLPRR